MVRVKMPKMPKMPKKGFLSLPSVRVLIVIILVVIIMVALVRAGLIPGQFALGLSGSMGGKINPQVGGVSFPLAADVSGSGSAGYQVAGEGFMNAAGRRENFAEESKIKEVVVYTREGCPHCKNFVEERDMFVKEVDSSNMGFKVRIEDKDFPSSVRGVPSVIMYKVDGSEEEYNGPRKASSLMDWVKKSM